MSSISRKGNFLMLAVATVVVEVVEVVEVVIAM